MRQLYFEPSRTEATNAQKLYTASIQQAAKQLSVYGENKQDYLAHKTGFSQQKISTLLKEKKIPQPELQTICKVVDIEPKKITSNFVVRQYEKFKTLLKQKKGK